MLAPFSETELAYINKQIALLFGLELDKRPRYRVSWANDQFENRYGEFEFFSGPIYLRSEVGVRRVKKYPWAENRYVLERLLFYHSKELPEGANGSYECIWPFVDKDNNYLPPNLQVCIKLIRHLEAPKEKKTEKDSWREEEIKRKKRIQYDVDYLNDIGPSPLFYPGETGKQGVFIDSTKVRK